MKTRSKLVLRLFFVLAGSLLLTACGSVVASQYSVEIEFPPDYTLLYVNEPVAITVHTNAPVTSMTFYVNDAPFGDIPINPVGVSSDRIWEGQYTWTPFLPGDYLLRVWVTPVSSRFWEAECDGRTCYEARKTIHVRVAEPPPSDGRGGGGEAPTPTAMALARLDFTADSPAIQFGGCTALRWESTNVTALTLDGNPVNTSGSQEVCPAEPTVYLLRGETLSGLLEKQVSINVVPPTETIPPSAIPPSAVPPSVVPPSLVPPVVEPPTPVPPTPVPDTSGPALSNFTADPGVVYDSATCGATSVKVKVKATDPSKISAVNLSYRVVRGGVQGKWISLKMSDIGKSEYQVTLSQGDLDQSLVSFADGTVEFYVTAVDGKGNSSTSGVISIQIKVCII